MKNTYPRHAKPQQGAALVVALIFLLVLTMLGVSAIQTSSMEERMAGSVKDTSAAFQAAEAALVEAESLIRNRTETSLAIGYYDIEPALFDATWPTAPDPAIPANWTAADSVAVSNVTFTADSLSLVKEQPRYRIERMELVRSNDSAETDAVPDLEPFLISASSTGGSGMARVVLQAAYRRKL